MNEITEILAAGYSRGQITRIPYLIGLLRFNGTSLADTANIVGMTRAEVRAEEVRLSHQTFPQIGRLLSSEYAAKPRAYSLQEV